MNIPAVEDGAVGTVSRIHREAGLAHYRRLAEFFSGASEVRRLQRLVAQRHGLRRNL